MTPIAHRTAPTKPISARSSWRLHSFHDVFALPIHRFIGHPRPRRWARGLGLGSGIGADVVPVRTQHRPALSTSALFELNRVIVEPPLCASPVVAPHVAGRAGGRDGCAAEVVLRARQRDPALHEGVG